MAKISDAKGRENGSGYVRVFDNEQLGYLLSRVQATVISSGSELEKMIISRSNLITNLDVFIEHVQSNQPGVYLCPKKVIKQSRYSTDKEPDLLVFIIDVHHNELKVIELKDGDAFDTKKSAGEKQTLEDFTNHIARSVPFAVNYYVCSFNQLNKNDIRIGFKNVFSIDEIMTGAELCELLSIDYDEIKTLRRTDATSNLRYFVEQLMLIPEVRSIIDEISNE